VWSPDGRRIAFSRQVAPVALIEVDASEGARGLGSLPPFSNPEQFFARPGRPTAAFSPAIAPSSAPIAE
jgi:hypothetical protein